MKIKNIVLVKFIAQIIRYIANTTYKQGGILYEKYYAKIYADIASGGAEYLPAGGTAAPVNNPRSYGRTKSGIYVPVRKDKFALNGNPRNRTSRNNRRR